MPGQAGYLHAVDEYVIPTDGSNVTQLTDTAGRRWADWNALPKLLPIVRAYIQHASPAGPNQTGRLTLSIDPGRYEIMRCAPPGYQVLQPPGTPGQSWAHNILLAGVYMLPNAPMEHWAGPFIPPIVLNRDFDSLWVDVSGSLTVATPPAIADEAAWFVGWDIDLADTLNAGYVSSGWLTSAGLVIANTVGVPNYGGYTLAQVVAPGIQSNNSIELVNGGGTQARVTFAAGSQAPLVISGAGIGMLNGPPLTPIPFSGHSGVTIATDQQLTSDPFPWSFDPSQPLLVKLGIVSGSVRAAQKLPGWTVWFKQGAPDAASSSIAGYSQSTWNPQGTAQGFILLETLH